MNSSLTPSDPHGANFESVSDAIDNINVAKLKAKEQRERDAYEASEFDAAKDKAGFRQFVDENESSKRFYM